MFKQASLKFSDDTIALSQNVDVTVVKEGDEWRITDQDNERTYAVRKKDSQLNIYETVKHPDWFRKQDDWRTFGLAEAFDQLRNYFENPDRYYGKDFSRYYPSAEGESDWTTIPWEELRNRYVSRYPDRAKPFIRQSEAPQKLSLQKRQVLDRTRYRITAVE